MSQTFSDIDESSFDAEQLLNPAVPLTRPSRPAPEAVSEEPRRQEPPQADRQAPDDTSQPAPQAENTSAAAEPAATVHAPSVKAETTRFSGARIAMFLGIVLFCLSVYTLIVSVSYFANISHDQSALLGGDTTPASFRNAGGIVGAWMAHHLLYEWLGIGSFILIFYMVRLALSLLKVARVDFWSLTFKCLLSAVSLSVISGLVTYEMASPVYWGGRHGYFLNHRLIELSGVWGAVGVSVIMAGLLVVMFFDSIMKCSRWIKVHIDRINERRRRERLQRIEAARAAAAPASMPTPAPAPAPVSAPVQASAPETPAAAVQTAPVEKDEEPAAADSSEDVVETPTEPAPARVEPLFIDSADDNDDDVASSGYDLFSDDTVDEDEPACDDAGELFGGDEAEAEDASESEDETEMVVEKPVIETCDEVVKDVYDPTAELSRYTFPTLDLLREIAYSTDNVDSYEMEENKQRITNTLNHYDIPISHIHATVGPTVTLYEIIPAEGVRIAKIKRLEDDIALSLAAIGIRIIAPIPGKGTIGIEVPNKEPQTVSIRSILSSRKFQESHMELPMAMGCTISNDVFMADLCKMPHLLVAGATGMGKSVGLNTIIASLLYKKHPAELKFVLIDPKMVEFSLYARLENHYLAKLPGEEDAIITDPLKVVATLNSLCIEMDNRYALLKMASCRNIKEYNERFVNRTLNPEKGHHFLPYIVVIVDEFADLIMTAGKEVETPIARIAQKARAVGIHMILATQRPSTNVITGVIKANFPGRVAFRVFQMVDSRTILDRPGANQLIGRGDMLFSNNGKIDRVQCAFIDTPEVEAICEAIGNQPGYGCAYALPEYVPEADAQAITGNPSDRDPLFGDAARYVVQTDTASTSSLQRRYSIGYNRAGKIMDQLEAAGIVGPAQGGKPRQVLLDTPSLDRILGSE